MPAASILIKPSSANCNMDCRYCFYKQLCSGREEYSKGFMSEETLEKLVQQAIDYAEGYLAFAFQGGEPTLAGLDFFRRAVALQKKYNTKQLIIENTIQTNGLFLDDEWAKFLVENDFLVGLSLDGPRKIHDYHRKDLSGKDTFERVMHTLELLKWHGISYNILSVITNESVEKATYLYKFYKRNHVAFVQLIPCMDEKCRRRQNITEGKENLHQDRFAVDAKRYGKFLTELFDLWYEDFLNGDPMEIRMFSNLVQMAAGYPAEQCGMSGCCQCYFVVEGDGSVYPCDFYCMDKWKLGSVEDSFQKLLESERAKQFVNCSRPLAEKCQICPYFSLCRGGCRRWREPFKEGKPGLNKLCEAYEVFFAHTRERIERLGSYLHSRYRGGVT